MIDQTTTIALVVALTQIIKQTGTIDNKFAPFLAIVIGVGFSLSNGITVDNVITGIVAGLTAAGFYSAGKSGAKIAGIIK